ncbi:copper transport protein ATOX1 [Patagioenas fasciata monilis]|uniref:Copper transport protein ATOX1 n=1 Tax=Patagioenas fasciata monilis TaxID=372326 RepID=A0A1V4KUI3_PATFA|nr:copper transport protein ATOX1 [Patagioenas fasciata monilis]
MGRGPGEKHEFFVDMTCEGCSNAVTRVLHKLGGVQFDIDLPNKKAARNSNMTSAKRWLNFCISPSLLCHLTFTTLPAVGKQGAGRKRQLYLGL